MTVTDVRRTGTASELVASGGFVLRTPRLPRDVLDRWGSELELAAAGLDLARVTTALAHDRARLRLRLRELALGPEFREAVFIASPSLDAGIDAWLQHPEAKDNVKIERGIVRYLSRMASRPTPFGLFAGNTVGELGDETRFELAPRVAYKRYSRVDGDYLSRLCDALAVIPELRARLKHAPNSSLCTCAGKLRYASRREGAMRAYSLVSIEPTEYLVATLERARGGALPDALATALCQTDPDISPAEAAAFVDELIDCQLLVSELAPLVTGAEAIDDVIEQLQAIDATAEAPLRKLRASLQALDRSHGSPQQYRAIAEDLKHALPVVPELNRLFQVNLIPAGERIVLGHHDVVELRQAIEALRRIDRGHEPADLAEFRRAFSARYENREVPLDQVLDEESGIGFVAQSDAATSASPLLEGIHFFADSADSRMRWTARDQHLARRIAEALAARADEIVLTEADIAAMASSEPPLPWPDALQVMAAVSRAPNGELRFDCAGASGPPGGALLGRFGHSDRALLGLVRANIAAEEALAPDVVFAEIVHLTDGRLANISARPVLRSHEIVYLGRSGMEPARQLPISDLQVSVRGHRIVLRSARLDREVRPRLTNAHNFTMRSLGVYRFLATLQGQGVARLGFDVGALSALPHVPRIRHGRVVLRGATWTLLAAELGGVVKSVDAERMIAIAQLRTTRRLPRWVSVEDGDNLLPVDLENAMSIDSFAHLIKDRSSVMLGELPLSSHELVAIGEGGRYAAEVVVPFVRRASPTVADPLSVQPFVGRRSFSPGSEWLYAKLYCGPASVDQILEAIRPVLTPCPRWFFVRFNDPEWHLRLRLHGEPAWLAREVMPALTRTMQALLDDGKIWKAQLDTYEREVERYGGEVGVVLAERLFHVDSACVLDILAMLDGDAGSRIRWQLTLRGLDRLLDDFELAIPDRLALLRETRDSFATEHHADATMHRELGEKYRKKSREVDALLAAPDDSGDLAPAFACIAARSIANRPIIRELRDAKLPIRALLPSYMHMHVNRMMRAAHRANELVLYDLLTRLYESRLARATRPRRDKS